MAAVGVAGDAAARLRASHMGDLNREHLIPQWLLPAAVGAVAREGSDEAADGC
jgi:hypothetical protein